MRLGSIVPLSLSAAIVLTLGTSFARAETEQIRGSQFVTIMSGNTLSGENRDGVTFKAYFLAGGRATYEDRDGGRDEGTWRIKDGELVCVTWKKLNEGAERCARVYSEGAKVVWRGDGVNGEGVLLGSVIPGFN